MARFVNCGECKPLATPKKRKPLTDAENEQLRYLERITCRVVPH